MLGRKAKFEDKSSRGAVDEPGAVEGHERNREGGGKCNQLGQSIVGKGECRGVSCEGLSDADCLWLQQLCMSLKAS